MLPNNDCAEVDNFQGPALNGCYEAHHPNTSLKEAELLRRVGEVEYDHKRVRDVEDWAYHHPHRFAVLTLKRMVWFWFPQTLPSAAEILKKGGYCDTGTSPWVDCLSESKWLDHM